MFLYGLQWTKCNLQQKYSVFVDVSECAVLLLRHKTDFKEDITMQYDVNKNEDIKQLHSGNHASSTNSAGNLSYFSLPCEHNIKIYGRVRY